MNTGSPTIGVAIIAKNESVLIGRCIESVIDADEIVVCDTGSIDNTIEVARKYTDKVYDDYTWEDSFSKARNHVLSKMTTDYVLSIDCDEYCHDFSKVREAVDIANKSGILAVNVKMIAEDSKNFFFFPRLFKRCPAVWWEGDIHNHISVAGSDISAIEITHGFSPAHEIDPERAYRILSKVVKETGNAREMYYLGREHLYRRELKECIDILSQYVEKTKFLSEKADAFLFMARAYKDLNDWDLARNMCSQAIIINPHFKEALVLMSELVWPRHASQWLQMAQTADNSEVLFIR